MNPQHNLPNQPDHPSNPKRKNALALFDLHGRVAIVTGGAGLLGAEFCRTLAEAGAAVVIADLKQVDLKQVDLKQVTSAALAGQLEQSSARAMALQVDITDPGSVNEMVERTLQDFGRLDILVNSAALDPKFDPQHAQSPPPVMGPPSNGDPPVMGNPGAFEDFPLQAWQQALDVNLTGAFLCCQAAVKPMLAQGQGVIINLSSIYGLAGPDQRIYQRPGQAAQFKPVYYSVTKWGILGLTQYLATYYAGKNIRVNALSPGGVYNGHDETFVQAYSARAVLGRMAAKDDLNGALLFLASDASAYMTGANLVVDGGWTAW